MTKAHDVLNLTKQMSSQEEDVENALSKKQDYDIERQVYPSLSNFAETLHDQLWKAYHTMQPQTIDYLIRVNSENKLLFMCDSLLTFFQEMGQYEFKSRIALIKIIYLHYKNDSIYEKID